MKEVTFDSLPKLVSELKTSISDLNSKVEKLLGGQEKPSNEVLNVKQAAKFLQVEVGTIYKYVGDREIPFSKKQGRLYFFTQDLINWVKSGKKRTQEEIKSQVDEDLGSF